MTDDQFDTARAAQVETLRHLLDDGIRPRQLVYVATALGVFDALKPGAQSGNELADAVTAEPDALYRVLRGLVALDLLVEDADGRFALTPASQLLCRSEPYPLRAEVLFRGEQDRAWAALMDGVRTGRTPFVSVFGEGIFAHVARDPALALIFHTWMAEWSDGFDAVAEVCLLPASGVIVDVGGGRGDLLVALLRRAPGMRGVLFDRAVNESGAAAFIATTEVASRCHVESGDFFERVPTGGDIYVLCRILHDWDDEAAGRILDRCLAAMTISATLLIVEKVLPKRVAENPSAIFLDLDMLVGVGGRQRTLAEYQLLFARHGFALDRVVDRCPESSVLIVRPSSGSAERWRRRHLH